MLYFCLFVFWKYYNHNEIEFDANDTWVLFNQLWLSWLPNIKLAAGWRSISLYIFNKKAHDALFIDHICVWFWIWISVWYGLESIPKVDNLIDFYCLEVQATHIICAKFDTCRNICSMLTLRDLAITRPLGGIANVICTMIRWCKVTKIVVDC